MCIAVVGTTYGRGGPTVVTLHCPAGPLKATYVVVPAGPFEARTILGVTLPAISVYSHLTQLELTLIWRSFIDID